MLSNNGQLSFIYALKHLPKPSRNAGIVELLWSLVRYYSVITVTRLIQCLRQRNKELGKTGGFMDFCNKCLQLEPLSLESDFKIEDRCIVL